VVRFGTVVPKGFLPVYSTDTEEEAKSLLTLACERNLNGEFIARELAAEQTIDNLFAFGHRLAEAHKLMKRRKVRRGRTDDTP
jgi:hypothetical protein